MITQVNKIYFLIKDQQFPVTSNYQDMTEKSEHDWKLKIRL